ncbi:BTAD domain-containing putative transcriptional regulator [Ostreiculturibacter nitratireducens]|uniref:BTAD domain-containing putative transcriptional regulator n=1 Tax=Ostreiculturibacter nitratireducens TaxID=3075226 RepID=UPI0031B5788C
MKIFLIGKPMIVASDGSRPTVPGHQPWAVLARLLCADRPLGRRELAAEIFPEVEDPLGALRWCLASLRRATGAKTLHSDPIVLNFPTDTCVDIWSLKSGEVEATGPNVFLEGVEPAASAAFDTWLLIEREHVSSRLYQCLRREAMRALSAGDHARARSLAERGVRCRPLDESGHIILVKCLAASGDIAAAVAHVDATETRFLKETGEKPTPALRAAARKTVTDPPHGVSKSAMIDALIKSGKAAVSAGAVDAGLDCLRRAAADAEKAGDEHLLAKALGQLGTSLIHACRGYDDEGALTLQQAADIASRIGSSDVAAEALCELGYCDALAGRRPSAAKYLEEALPYAQDNDECLAGIHAFVGFNLVDWGRVELGLSHFERSLEFARKAENRRREIWALGIGAWGLLRSGRPDEARDWLVQCLRLCDEIRWLAFRPWPVALLAEARLALHEMGNATRGDLEEALAISNQLADPCWQAAAARALALVDTDAGEYEAAARWLVHARERCCSVTDLYAGLLVEIMSDQVRLSKRIGDDKGAAELARQLLPVVARTHADAHLDFATAMLNPSSRPHRAGL